MEGEWSKDRTYRHIYFALDKKDKKSSSNVEEWELKSRSRFGVYLWIVFLTIITRNNQQKFV